MLGGKSDRWDGFPTNEPIDALVTFEAMKEAIVYRWSHFVVYMDWLTTTLPPERAYQTWQALEKRHPQEVLNIPVHWVVTKTCRNANAVSAHTDP